eukprot:306046-Amorphochlora_amoeboformis.AAC.1
MSRYQYTIKTIPINFTQLKLWRSRRFPEIARDCQRLPDIVRDCRRLPQIAGDCRRLPGPPHIVLSGTTRYYP